MTTDQIRDVIKERPFTPFKIHLSDGRSFQVDHPEFLALSRGGRIAFFVTPDDTLERIDLLHVTSLEQQRASLNGDG